MSKMRGGVVVMVNLEKIKLDFQEIAAEQSTIINMSFQQFITSYYNHHNKAPDIYQLVLFYSTLTIEEIILGRDIIIEQWRKQL